MTDKYAIALALIVGAGLGSGIMYNIVNDEPNWPALCYTVEQHWEKWTAWNGGGAYYRNMARKSKAIRSEYPTQAEYEEAFHWLSMQDPKYAAKIADDCLIERSVVYDFQRSKK